MNDIEAAGQTKYDQLIQVAKIINKDMSGYEWSGSCFWAYLGDATHTWDPLTNANDALKVANQLNLKVSIVWSVVTVEDLNAAKSYNFHAPANNKSIDLATCEIIVSSVIDIFGENNDR